MKISIQKTLNDFIQGGGHLKQIGPIVINCSIALSILLLIFSTEPYLSDRQRLWLGHAQIFLLFLFFIEYCIRIYIAPSRLKYIFSFWGVIDFLAILPLLGVAQNIQSIRIIRILKLLHQLSITSHGRALDKLIKAMGMIWNELLSFIILAFFLLVIAATGIYSFEHKVQPEVFSSIATSLWWAIVTFSTVGYGDMYPITLGGRIFTTVILIIGLGLVAFPAALITSALTKLTIDPDKEDDSET